MKLLYAADHPPLAVIAACHIADLPISMEAFSSHPSFIPLEGSTVDGTDEILKHIGKTVTHLTLYGKDADQSRHIDEWLDYIPIFSKGCEFEAACNYADSYLSTCTFLVGHQLSIADIALFSALARTGQRWESLRRSIKYKNLVRWYHALRFEYNSSVNQVLRMVVGKRKPTPGLSTESGYLNHANGQTNHVNGHTNHANGHINHANGYISHVKGEISQAKGDINKTKAPISNLPEMDLPNAEAGKVCLRHRCD